MKTRIHNNIPIVYYKEKIIIYDTIKHKNRFNNNLIKKI